MINDKNLNALMIHYNYLVKTYNKKITVIIANN